MATLYSVKELDNLKMWCDDEDRSYPEPKEMFDKEAEIVDDAFLAEENTYNLKRGGFGGFDYINSMLDTEQRVKISSKGGLAKKNVPTDQRISWKKSGVSGEENSNRQQIEYSNGRINGFLNKKHTLVAKAAIGIANKQNSSGINNSQFGSRWISHPDLGNKKCSSNTLSDYLNNGWVLGRK